MNTNDITVRLEEKKDYRKNETLIRNSFWNVYRPGCFEHYVLHTMRCFDGFVPELDFVMEKCGELIGQAAFVKAFIKSDKGKNIPVMALGPICIEPRYQRKGYGKFLLDYALRKAADYGCKAVCLEGNYNFYSQCGFTYASNFGIRYHGLNNDDDSSFFLCKELEKGYLDNITGEYSPPECYFVDEAKVDEFDNRFEYKQKLKLDTQLF